LNANRGSLALAPSLLTCPGRLLPRLLDRLLLGSGGHDAGLIVDVPHTTRQEENRKRMQRQGMQVGVFQELMSAAVFALSYPLV
jgi:hypothetical protein